MKQTVIKIFKIALIATAAVLVVLLIFGMTLIIGWPWWAGFFLLLGLVGLGLGAFILKKLLVKRREQQFVTQVIEQDEQYLKQMGGKDRERFKELQDRWREAVTALRRSHLKKYGNPLYVLPWYLVMGESGSGKTTAIQSARLSSPFAEVSRSSGISGTRNCDWWFFEQAILIDTAGRYAIPIDEGRDKEEWEKFLGLLVKFRKKEPLNGLVVTIPADKLAGAAPESLESDGKNIRRRVDELMRVLGARFPVYALVTKCDLVHGMNQFCQYLDEEKLDQAMGRLNSNLASDAASLLERVIHSIGERLRDYRLLIYHRPKAPGGDANAAASFDAQALLFPEEFERLETGLRAFLRGAFQENPYQETPILRGIYFSSGRQEGTPYSHFLKELGLISERDVLPGTNKGLFLHDFFSKILPRDRGLFAPTERARHWQQLTRNLGLTAWLAVGIAICGLLSFAFVKNLRTMRDITTSFKGAHIFQGDLFKDVNLMTDYRQAVIKVGERNRNWWIPRFGLNQSHLIEDELRTDFCHKFTGHFLSEFDDRMLREISGFSERTPDALVGDYVSHLVRRINLLNAHLKGHSLSALQQLPQPSYSPLEVLADQAVISEVKNRFESLYLTYLTWQPDNAGLNKEMVQLQDWLKHILELKKSNLNWVMNWANQTPSLSDARLTLDDFWGGHLSASAGLQIEPAFTITGRETIFSFIREIEEALSGVSNWSIDLKQFEERYELAYLAAWEAFAAGFSEGAGLLPDREAWLEVAARVGTDQSPYFLLLDHMAAQLAPLKNSSPGAAERPIWFAQVQEFSSNRQEAVALAKEGDLPKPGVLKKAATRLKSTVSKLERQTGLASESFLNPKSELISIQAVREYQKALEALAPVAMSRKTAYEMTREIFSQDAATGTSPYFAAHKAVNALKVVYTGSNSDTGLFWDLIGGPLNFVFAFMFNETQCQLQKQWEEEVLVKVQDVPDPRTRNRMLFGPERYAKQYVEESCRPFIERSLDKGFQPRQVQGREMPFDPSFLNFLRRGYKASVPGPEPAPRPDTYRVSLQALPTDVNPGAMMLPHVTVLEIFCGGKSTILQNYMDFPPAESITWSPSDCGEVTLKIGVENYLLVKEYTGKLAFAKFLKEFRNGQRTFKSREFPDASADLERMGIDAIIVKYKIRGHRPILDLLKPLPPKLVVPQPPRYIIGCWDQ